MQTSPLSSLTFGEAFAFIRDFSVIVSTVVVGWYARGGYQVGRDFFNRVSQHMSMMEGFAHTVVTNHLRHIEADLKLLSGRKDDLPGAE